ncbi:MAG: NAD+ synthase [Nitriliruptorales bacterium]
MALRLALAQVDTLVGDIDGNVDRILAAWRRAAEAGADLVAFPELAVTGYPPEDLLLKPEFVEANTAAVRKLAERGPTETAAVIGFVGQDDGHGDGDGDGREWDVTVAAREDLHNSAVAIVEGRVVGTYHKGRLPIYGVFDEARWFGVDDDPLVVEVAGTRVGITICEDMWTEGGPVARSVAAGAEAVVNINASPYHRGKHEDRERWARHHAGSRDVWVAYVNCVGGQDGLVFDGDSFVCAPGEDVVARGAQFAEDLVVVDLDPDAERPQVPDRLDPVEEVWAALVLGTGDYCRKNRFEKAVVGLSGGIDSSVTAAVAADALGPENVLGVLMPSRFTSDASIEDAEELGANLGIELVTLPITDGVEALEGTLADLFAGTERDETEENVQARIRGVLLMAISNKFGHIVLSTGNKSEAAVGYSTLYGDMAGGFAVLIDVNKQLVYALARRRNERGAAIPERVLTKAPSAELRPDQRDEDSLGPYEVLDPILCAYVEEDTPIDEIVALGYDLDTVRRVVRMVDRAEYKRRQAPPGVKITERAFGQDRRVPITNAWRP